MAALTLDEFLTARIREEVAAARAPMIQYHHEVCGPEEDEDEQDHYCRCGEDNPAEWEQWICNVRAARAKGHILHWHQDMDGKCAPADHRDDHLAVYQGHGPYPCPTLRAFARSYADHPNFEQEWL